MRTIINLDDDLHRHGRTAVIAPDVNVLLYAFRAESERHETVIIG